MKIFEEIAAGNKTFISDAVEKSDFNVKKEDEYGQSLLLYSLRARQIEIANLLLTRGCTLKNLHEILLVPVTAESAKFIIENTEKVFVQRELYTLSEILEASSLLETIAALGENIESINKDSLRAFRRFHNTLKSPQSPFTLASSSPFSSTVTSPSPSSSFISPSPSPSSSLRASTPMSASRLSPINLEAQKELSQSLSGRSVLRDSNGDAVLVFSKRNLIGQGSNAVVYRGISIPNGDLRAVKELRTVVDNDSDITPESSYTSSYTSSYGSSYESSEESDHHEVEGRKLSPIQKEALMLQTAGQYSEVIDEKYLVLNYKSGPNLKDYLENTQRNFTDNLEIIIQSLIAIEDMSKRKMCHGDIKPANIILHNDKCTLIDYACAVHESEAHEIRLQGSPLYMSPELYLKHKISTASDVYAAGILILDILVKKCKLDGSTNIMLKYNAVLKKIKKGQPVDVIPFIARAYADVLEFPANDLMKKTVKHIKSMIDVRPKKRPSITESLQFFKAIEILHINQELPFSIMEDAQSVPATPALCFNFSRTLACPLETLSKPHSRKRNLTATI